jgi:putative Mg2+ transporter-C (MgtC) family protein
VRFAPDAALPEAELREMLKEHGFSARNLSYRLDRAADFFEYKMFIRSRRRHNAKRLTDALGKLPAVKEFRILPTGN